MDWKKLYVGKVSKNEVMDAIQDPAWQETRIYMKGKSTEEKYGILERYVNNAKARLKADYEENGDRGWYEAECRMIDVQATNYITALSRGGLIKPSDYREEA